MVCLDLSFYQLIPDCSNKRMRSIEHTAYMSNKNIEYIATDAREWLLWMRVPHVAMDARASRMPDWDG